MKTIALILLTITTLGANAQNYIPMLGDLNEWYVHYIGFGFSTTGLFTAEIDTTIGSTQYSRLYSSKPGGAKHFIYFLSEDTVTQQVCIYQLDSLNGIDVASKKLLYDFKVEENDTVSVGFKPDFMGGWDRSDTLVVRSLEEFDSLDVCINPSGTGPFINDSARVYSLTDTEVPSGGSPEEDISWIEGTGSSGGPISPSRAGNECTTIMLTCHYKDGILEFKLGSSIFFDTCIMSVSIDEEEISSLFVYPNPTSSSLWIDIPGIDGRIESISLLSLDSKIVKTVSVDRVDSLLEFSLENIPSGLYLLRLTGKDKYYFKKITKI